MVSSLSNTIRLEAPNTISLEGDNIISLPSTAGGSAKSSEVEKQRAYNRKLREKLQVERERAVQADQKKPKRKKIIKIDIKKQLKVAAQDKEWVREKIDKPFEFEGNELELELRKRDQVVRDQMESERLAVEAFLKDEEEAISQILIAMI